MLDAQQITLRFLDTRLQVHPDVVRYIQEQDNPEPDRPHHRRRPGGYRGCLGKAYPGHERDPGRYTFFNRPDRRDRLGRPRLHREASTALPITSIISGIGPAGSAG